MKGLVPEAIKANLQALNVQPEFPVAHNNLAVAYLETGEFDKAIAHCDNAEKLGFQVAQDLKDELAPHRKA
jgi:tetratricopeptide (TPR) repeat protein